MPQKTDMQISICKIEIFSPKCKQKQKKTQFVWKQDPVAHLEYGAKEADYPWLIFQPCAVKKEAKKFAYICLVFT